MATLTGISEDVKGQIIEVSAEPVSIGRTGENTISLNNPTVSSRHCVLVKESNKYVLRDLGSTNGTRVNSRDIQEANLKPKDIVQVGSVEFLFDADDVAFEETGKLADAQVEEAAGPSAAPESFSSISPFGARKSESKGFLFFLITIVFLLALAAVVFFFIRLVTTT